MDIHVHSFICKAILEIHNLMAVVWIKDLHNWIMNIRNRNFMYIYNCILDNHNWFMDNLIRVIRN